MDQAFVKKTPENTILLRFGGGLNTRASEDELKPIEAASGENFKLDPRDRQLVNRGGIDLVGTVPNASEIRGGASLLKSDGSVSMLIQALDKVYEWNGSSFSSVGTVAAAAKLRGRLEANFTLNDEVIITDINLQHPVLVWDGTTLSTMTENLTGDFLAKYCFVSDERAFFGNVISNAVATPHMVVGSQRGDNTVLSITDRPSSGATLTDPFFLLTPDLRPVNGLVEAFGQVIVSSQKGRIFKLLGSDATDYRFDQLYANSAASGDESLVYTGNDVFYGRDGRIESLLATERFGDVEAADVSIDIANSIESFSNWVSVYNSRLDRVYFFPGGSQSQVWVFHKSVPDVSPWVKYTSQHASSMQPTFAMNMLDPADGLEYLFFGDSSGRLFRMEGSGGDDAGANIKTSFTSRLFSAPFGGQFSSVNGWIKYRSNEAFTATLSILWAGEQVFTESRTVTATAASGDYFGGDTWFGGDFYWGSATFDRLVRQRIGFPGKSNEFQVKVEIDGTADFKINEVGLHFKTSS